MKLLIIDTNPFGILTDVVKWTQYLSKYWDITVLCFSPRHQKRAQVDNVKIKEVYNWSNRKIKALIFILRCIIELMFFRGKIMVVYFPYCEIFKRLFPKKKMILDIRTMSVNPDESIRYKANQRIIKACRYFDKITAISQGVVNMLKRKDAVVLPLGSDIISSVSKNYTQSINVLYVGIFSNRNIGETIKGAVAFHEGNPSIPFVYRIIGYGTYEEESLLLKLIHDLHAKEYIELVGRVPHDQLQKFFDISNVGLSFVPMTDYFNYQPPTKTFEYCQSGLYCIATGTEANKEIITSSNGIIINDTPQGVVDGLTVFWQRRSSISEVSIRESLISNTWESIVGNILEPLLTSLY